MLLRKYYIQIITLFFATIILAGCGAAASGSSTGPSNTGNLGGSGGGGIGTGTATLSWTPPTQNNDGSTLTNLAGYKIYYGTSSGSYNHVLKINNPGIATYVVDNLAAGYTYYFVITAFNSSGYESDYSQERSKTI